MFRFSNLLFFLLLTQLATAQRCNYQISGTITDELTQEPLPFATVFIEETQQGVAADENGHYRIGNICVESVHVRVNHVSCEPLRQFIKLTDSTQLDIKLHHHAELLNELQVHGSTSEKSPQVNSSINSVEIDKNGNQNLADILEQLTGVTTLKNGSGISKPVINGLFGNRISILNNGIAQSGQQWGIDHAPEIDPFSADHLTVVKGVSALAYNGSTLGGVVLVESKPIPNEPHTHGTVNYLYNTNGRGNTLNAKIEKSGKWINWRANGTIKIQGDTHAPNYFLTNTARREANAAIRFEKRLNQKWNTSFIYSTFNTDVGILQGSQIGNLTDLRLALSRKIPFFTADKFRYAIEEPRQAVNHHLAKLEFNALLSPHKTLKLTYGGQLNNRREFDARRGDRSSKPVLSLNQWSHFVEAKYTQDFPNGGTVITGIQETLTDNTNVPETGINPLIPDYLAFNTALFTLYNLKNDRWLHELGIRLENKQLNVVRITRTIPREIERINQNFVYYGFSGGTQLTLPHHVTINANLGIAMRPPEVNELYSFGLHQGVSSIEEGNENLKSEQSIKGLVSVKYHAKKLIFLELTPYIQHINNFIYLQPQRDFLLTIRGAFPYFKFEQTQALLYGTDVLVSIEPGERLKIINKFSFVRGIDQTNDIPLVFIPPASVSSALKITLPDAGRFEDNTFKLEVEHTAQQRNLLPEQDFVIPPAGYTLLNASVDTQFKINKYYISLGLAASNLLNTSYRNYLNRLRYFADDVGRNITLQTKITF